jgi:hypothetical protein
LSSNQSIRSTLIRTFRNPFGPLGIASIITIVAHVMGRPRDPDHGSGQGAMWVHSGYTAFLPRSQKGKFPLKINGWRRSADRTSLRTDSLLTGNSTGKITISGLWDALLMPEVTVL